MGNGRGPEGGVVVQLAQVAEQRDRRRPQTSTQHTSRPAEAATHAHYVTENLKFIGTTFEQLLEPLRAVLEAGENGLQTDQLARVLTQIEALDLSFLGEEIPNAVGESLEGVTAMSEMLNPTKDRWTSPS